MNIKQESKEEDLGSTKVSKKNSRKWRRMLKFDSAKEEFQEMEEINDEFSLKTKKTDQKSFIRNLHNEHSHKLSMKEERKSEESKNEWEESEYGEQTPNDFTIDMNWNEVLSELENSDLKTIRTIQSQSNEQKDMITGEKADRASRIERFKIDSHHSHKSNQIDFNENNYVGNYTATRRGLLNNRKDYSSLKRNLFSEFNSLIHDDNVKKDTEDEIFSSSQVVQEFKQPSWKQDAKVVDLDWMSPINIEAIKYNPCIDTPSINRELCGKKRLRYESCYSSGWENCTPRLYEQWEDGKERIYYQPAQIPVNPYEQYENREQDENEEDQESDMNPGIKTARSERGLKRLSVKVRDLVFKLKETSYKDVANKLIEELVTDGEFDEYGRKLDK